MFESVPCKFFYIKVVLKCERLLIFAFQTPQNFNLSKFKSRIFLYNIFLKPEKYKNSVKKIYLLCNLFLDKLILIVL